MALDKYNTGLERLDPETLEIYLDKHFREDVALEYEFDDRFAASDLLGASSVLHLQAMQEAALGNSTSARVVAETAIHFASLFLGMHEDTTVQLQGVARLYADRAAYHTDPEVHHSIQEAAESGVEAARHQLMQFRNTIIQNNRNSPLKLPFHYQHAQFRSGCYALQMYSQIAQDQFFGTDPTLDERNQALWWATDTVDRLTIDREKGEHAARFVPTAIKRQLIQFAFDLIEAYEPAKAERGQVLEARDACYQALFDTVRKLSRQQTDPLQDLRRSITYARYDIESERNELGLAAFGEYGEILEKWEAARKAEL